MTSIVFSILFKCFFKFIQRVGRQKKNSSVLSLPQNHVPLTPFFVLEPVFPHASTKARDNSAKLFFFLFLQLSVKEGPGRRERIKTFFNLIRHRGPARVTKKFVETIYFVG
jgi:hypothetical protein